MESKFILLSISVDKHKESQINWVKDAHPIVEANIGFIETYSDPIGVRAEFEGWVAIVNKEQSKKLADLVANATNLIAKFPWSKEFEKDEFQKPDFTSLEVVAFGCSGTPLGICIPNYNEIRQEIGFKNVNLGNNLAKPTEKTAKFLAPEDLEDYIKYYEEAKFLQVALHELLGHGSGKLFQIDAKTGKPNFHEGFKDPFTNEVITTYYGKGETFESRFGHMHSAYEECRADSVANYLSCEELAMKILFPGRESDWNKILETIWLGVIQEAIRGLEYYNPELKKWTQAHVNGRYVIMSVLKEAGLIKLEVCKKDGKDDIIVRIDKSKIKTEGKEAMGKFLKKLHVFRCLGDLKRGTEVFSFYSQVSEEMLKIRDIVMLNKPPRRMELQGNVMLDGSGDVKYVTYDSTFAGVIASFVERFDKFDTEMYEYWKSCRKCFNPL